MEEIRALKERLEGERPVDWEGFPDIGLYMDQLINYMPRQLIHYGEGETLTSAMVNNYIKDGAMPRAEGKRYSRTHLAYLTALCALKQVLSVKDAGLLLAAATAVSAIVNLQRRKSSLAGGMLALAVFALFSYPLSIMQFRILLVLFLASCGPVRRRGSKAETLLTAVAALACTGACIALKPSADALKDAERKWKRISAYSAHGATQEDVEAMLAIRERLSDNFRYLYDLGYALHRCGHFEESNRVLAEGAEISSDPMFRVIMGRNFEALGDYARAEEEYLKAHYTVPCRIYPLLRLMRLQSWM